MAKKKVNTVVTHTEILCYAINHLISRIADDAARCSRLPEGEAKEMFTALAGEKVAKLEVLKELYRFETGTEYAE